VIVSHLGEAKNKFATLRRGHFSLLGEKENKYMSRARLEIICAPRGDEKKIHFYSLVGKCESVSINHAENRLLGLWGREKQRESHALLCIYTQHTNLNLAPCAPQQHAFQKQFNRFFPPPQHKNTRLFVLHHPRVHCVSFFTQIK
jgi:hypothetical protein